MRVSSPPLAAIVVAGSVASSICSAQPLGDTVNFARYQFATATSTLGEYSPLFLADGKIGPRNRWVSTNRGRHRLNVFLEEEVTLGSLHLYSFAYDMPPVSELEVFYLDPVLQDIVAVPGSAVLGNTDESLEIIFAAPVTTRQIQVRIEDQSASVDEIALFPPNGGAGFPLGTDVNMHQGRQHRLALTPASSRATGSERRAVVDGFVNDSDVWRTSGSGPHWIDLDVSDPPETDPAEVRVDTTPVRVGSAHLYSGTAAGTEIVQSGRFQRFDESLGWTDILGGSFAANSSPFLAVEFSEVVETPRLRLVIDDLSTVTVSEIVPLPPVIGGQMWPEGTSVVLAGEPDYRDLGDDYYALVSVPTSLAITTDGAGLPFAGFDAGALIQQYQVLYNVGSDTYRIVNRRSGQALAVEGASTLSGAAVVEADYSALPHQRWRLVENTGEYQFVNAMTGMALALAGSSEGAVLEQEPVRSDRPLQRFSLVHRTHFGKKGHGGFPQLAGDTTKPDWAYNWGKDDTYPAEVDYWPMQWGSFFWNQWPEMVPLWKRSSEPIVLMGYNEPDNPPPQSDIPVQVGIDMWPRMEVIELPLLAPAPVNPTNDWISQFMGGVDQHEMRVEYVAVHSYGSPNADSFINKLANTRAAFDNRDVVVSEFSVVDWNDNNAWTDDSCFNFFAEVFWRMEALPWVRRYAVFVFTDDPANPISDNRGEMLNQDGTLTPEGMLLAAWDGDTVIRTDTPYHLHNEASFNRVGSVAGQNNENSVQLGTKSDVDPAFRWHLVPTDVTGEFNIESVDDGRLMTFSSRGVILIDPASAGPGATFRLVEAEHGWFHVEETLLGRRLESDPADGSLDWATPGTSGASTRWRFAPVFNGPPAAPRSLTATPLGAGQVDLSWADHGFRDLEGMQVFRQDPMGSLTLIAENVIGTTFSDQVPQAGSYYYEVVAVGDTGFSAPSGVMISVDTCAADFNGDFQVSSDDVTAAITAIDGGLDYNSDGQADFFDVIDYLDAFEGGCN